MTPEQAVQASLDENDKNMMLMHWGAVLLAYHSWNEPIERALKEAKKSGVNLIDPPIDETVLLDSDLNIPDYSWWDLKKAKP